jgi:Reverse transcriptase (RNA-dependent DNA polymerase).
MAYATALEKKVDMVVVSEPNKILVRKSSWLKDRRADIAVFFVNKSVEVLKIQEEDGFMILSFQSFTMVCGYCSPNIPVLEFELYVDRLMTATRDIAGEKLILGDFNVKSPLWGSPVWDVRGKYWCEWVAAMNLIVINDGKIPTWTRGNSESFIDITCATEQLAGRVLEWEVLMAETLSDHRFITFDILTRTRKDTGKERQISLMNPTRYKERLMYRMNELGQGNLTIDSLSGAIKTAYKASLVRRGRGKVALLPYWWNVEIENARKESIAARREMTRQKRRMLRPGEAQVFIDEYKNKKRYLSKLIQQSKKTHWDKLCTDLEGDIWGKGYQIATKNLRNPEPPLRLTEMKRIEIARSLFKETNDDWELTSDHHGDTPPFTVDEVKFAAGNLKPGKSPGPDGVPAEAIKLAVDLIPNTMTEELSDLLIRGKFPNAWKNAKLALIWKGKHPIDAPTSYRPICMLDTLGKLFEALIRNRLTTELERREGLSPRQFGFRKGRSTVQAAEYVKDWVRQSRYRMCALFTLDVRNAFNTASWSIIIQELRRRQIPDYLVRMVEDYFKDRRVQVSPEAEIGMSMGVPQGSIIGPTLWNVLYDDVLRLNLGDRVLSVAFADDLALLVVADRPEELKWRADRALGKVDGWMKDHKLALAPEKTEVVLLKGSKRRPVVDFVLQGMSIRPKNSVKYLGIHFDVHATFGKHVSEVCAKADRHTGALHRVLPNLRGPSSSKRKTMLGMVHSIITYAAPVWHQALGMQKYRSMVISSQRRMLLRVVSAYRTVSGVALQVIAGVPPIDLTIEERKRLYDREDGNSAHAHKEELDRTLETWQERWNEEIRVAQWTKKLIPNIRVWLECNHRRVDYYLTQFLSGHGSFKQYACRIGRAEGEQCIVCGQRDTPGHSVFECTRWDTDREELHGQLGVVLTADNIISEMLRGVRSWKIIRKYIATVLETKERERRQEN